MPIRAVHIQNGSVILWHKGLISTLTALIIEFPRWMRHRCLILCLRCAGDDKSTKQKAKLIGTKDHAEVETDLFIKENG